MITTPAKTKLNQRLHAERRHGAFILVREALKRCGVSDRDAWKLAGTKFPPTNGDPLEYEPPDIPWPENFELAMQGGEFEAAVGETVAADVGEDAEDKPTAYPWSFLQSTDDDLEFFIDGSLDTVAELEPNSTWEGDSRPPAKGIKRGPGRPRKSPAPIGYVRDVSENTKKLAAEVGRNANENEQFDALVASVDETKKSSTIERLEWIYENAATPWSLIRVEGVPSRGALKMLRWVKANDTNYEKFVTGLWSKTIPAKSQLDQEGRFADDGRKSLKLMEEFEASLLEPENTAEVDGE